MDQQGEYATNGDHDDLHFRCHCGRTVVIHEPTPATTRSHCTRCLRRGAAARMVEAPGNLVRHSPEPALAF